MRKILVIVIQLFLLGQISSALALSSDKSDQEDNSQDTIPSQDIPAPEYVPPSQGIVTSMDAYSDEGEQTATSLQFAAKYAADQGDYEKAIKLCRRALRQDYNDIDVHKTYAEVLEDKLNDQNEPDHDLLNGCIREWLIVFRTEVGDEKGLSFHGISPFGHLYEDEDRSIPARSHLVTLTGRAPKPWETDEKYMKWVNRPTTSVAGQLLTKKPSSDTK